MIHWHDCMPSFSESIEANPPICRSITISKNISIFGATKFLEVCRFQAVERDASKVLCQVLSGVRDLSNSMVFGTAARWNWDGWCHAANHHQPMQIGWATHHPQFRNIVIDKASQSPNFHNQFKSWVIWIALVPSSEYSLAYYVSCLDHECHGLPFPCHLRCLSCLQPQPRQSLSCRSLKCIGWQWGCATAMDLSERWARVRSGRKFQIASGVNLGSLRA